ncbi:MAG: 50S ribosomal protein L9 [bacterium]|nr:50S ribosomal protein L9 [bacterium]
MKIILLQDVKSLGKKGDVKEVAEGYAQNFLLPKKLAGVATESAVKFFQSQKEKEQKNKLAETERLRNLASVLKGKKITIEAKEKKGKLFGSITVKNIEEALKKEGLNILANSIIIKQAIKKVGEYEIEIKLSEEIREKIKLEVRGIE